MASPGLLYVQDKLGQDSLRKTDLSDTFNHIDPKHDLSGLHFVHRGQS